MADAIFVQSEFNTRQIVLVDDTLSPEQGIKELLRSIPGFSWDDAFWSNQNLLNEDAIIPRLWDASKRNISNSQWQSGVGDTNDLKVRRVDTFKEDNKSDWKPVVYHGRYYELDNPFFLFSDSSRVLFMGEWQATALTEPYTGLTRGFHRIGFLFNSDDLPVTLDFFGYTLILDSSGVHLLGEDSEYLFEASKEYSCTVIVYPKEIQVFINGSRVLAVLDDTNSSGDVVFDLNATDTFVKEFSAPANPKEISLVGVPKQGLPITAYQFRREQSDESQIFIEKDIKKKVFFTGVLRINERLATEDSNGEVIEANLDLTKDEFLVKYDEDPVRAVFNKDQIVQVGLATLPTTITTIASEHPIHVNEFLGIGAINTFSANYNLNKFPVLRDDRGTFYLWVFDPSSVTVDSDWKEVSNVSYYPAGSKVFEVDRDLGIVKFGSKAPSTRVNIGANLLPLGAKNIPVVSTEGYPNSGTIHIKDSMGNEEYVNYGFKTPISFISTTGTTKVWDSDALVYDLDADESVYHGLIPAQEEEIYASYKASVKLEYEEEWVSNDIIPVDLPLNPVENSRPRSIIHLSRRLIAVDQLVLSSDRTSVAIGSDFASLSVLATANIGGESFPVTNLPITLHIEEQITSLGTLAGAGANLTLNSNGLGRINTVFLPPSSTNNLGLYFEQDDITIDGTDIKFNLPLEITGDFVDLSNSVPEDVYLYQVLKDDPLSGRAHRNIRITIDEPIEFVETGTNLYEYTVKTGLHANSNGALIPGDIVTDDDTNNPGTPNGLTPEIKNFSADPNMFQTRVTVAPTSHGEYRFIMSDYPSDRLDSFGNPLTDEETAGVGKIQLYYDTGVGTDDPETAELELTYYRYDFDGEDIDFFLDSGGNSGNGRKVVVYEFDPAALHPILDSLEWQPDDFDYDVGVQPASGAYVPSRPTSITEDQVIFSFSEFPTANNSKTTTNPDFGGILGGYWVVTTRVVTIYASAINEITGQEIQSNRIQIKITMPQYLLGEYITPTSSETIPYGWKFIGVTPANPSEQIPSALIQAATGLNGATYISINPVAGPYPLVLDGISLEPVGTQIETFNKISYRMTVE